MCIQYSLCMREKSMYSLCPVLIRICCETFSSFRCLFYTKSGGLYQEVMYFIASSRGFRYYLYGEWYGGAVTAVTWFRKFVIYAVLEGVYRLYYKHCISRGCSFLCKIFFKEWESCSYTRRVCMINWSQASCGNMLLKTRWAALTCLQKHFSTRGLRSADHTPRLTRIRTLKSFWLGYSGPHGWCPVDHFEISV